MSRATVLDLGDFYRRQGARAERKSTIDFLSRMADEVAKEPTGEEEGQMSESEKAGALGILKVLTETLAGTADRG